MDEFGKSRAGCTKGQQRGRIKICLFCLCICFAFCALFSSAVVYVKHYDNLAKAGEQVAPVDKQYLSSENPADSQDSQDASTVQTGSGAVVIEQSSCRILYENNKDAKLYPASTTKVLTALVVLENLPLEKVIKIPKLAVGIEGSSIYLRENESLSVKELLLGLMLRSGNDSAVALALSISPTIEEFAELMNSTAKRIGAVNSNFKNPHGLHDDDHYTTAYDLALITAQAFKNKDFCEIVSTKSAVLSGVDEKRYIQNKNKILWQYEGGNGVKTGYTKMSGRCLVASAMREGMQVISVVLNHGAMWEDSKSYMDYSFATYKMAPMYEELTESVKVKNGKSDFTVVKAETPPCYPIKKDGSEKFEVKFSLQTLNAPIMSGTECGIVKVNLSNHLIFEGKLYTMENIAKKSFRDKFIEFFTRKKN